MSAVLVISIFLRLCATIVAIILLRKQRDWRLSFLVVLILLMVAQDVLELTQHVLPGFSLVPQLHVAELVLSFLVLISFAYFGSMLEDQRRARSALHMDKNFLQRLIDALPAYVSYIDARHNYVVVNHQYEKTFAKPRKLIEGRHVLETVGSETYANVRGAMEAALSGEAVDAEVVIKPPGSEPRILNASYCPDRDESGVVRGLFLLALDVTDLKLAQDALRESEERFREYTDIASDWFWETGPDLKISFLSERVEKIIGIPAQEFIGKRRLETGEIIADPSALKNHLQDMKQRRRFRNFPYAKRHPDGKIRHFRSSGRPIYDESGTFLGYRGVSSDVTREVEIESRRQQAEQSFLRAIDVLPVAFTMYDSDDRMVICNRLYRQSYQSNNVQAETGVHFEDMLESFEKSGRLGTNAAVIENWHRARSNRRNAPAHGFLYHDVNGRWVEINDYLLDDDSIITIGADVTDRRNAEEQVRQHALELAQVLRRRTMGEMAAMLAHELNQPLTATLNFSTGAINRLKSNRLDQDELREVLNEIHSQAKRAEEVLNRVAAFLRPNAKIGRKGAGVRILDAVDSVAVLAQAELSAHQINFKPSIPPDLPMVSASKIELEQVLLNLVRNSIEAMQEGGCDGRILKVGAKRENRNVVRIDVVDSGPGLDPSIEDRVFEPFATTKSEGLGMGFAISRRIVEGAGGRLWIEDSGPEGLHVSMTLSAQLAG